MTSTSRPTKSWQCPECEWVENAHPIYGWASHNDHAVEVHKTMLCPSTSRPTKEPEKDATDHWCEPPTDPCTAQSTWTCPTCGYHWKAYDPHAEGGITTESILATIPKGALGWRTTSNKQRRDY